MPGQRYAAITMALALTILPASAQENAATNYPNNRIRIVVGFAAGGGVDLIARVVAEGLSQRWNQPVIVENRIGAAGNVGSETVFNSPPDGYTLLAGPQGPFVANKALYKNLRIDPDKLEHVSIATLIPAVLAVPGTSRFKTVEDFLSFARANPGKLNFASQGNGSSGHLIAVMLEQALKTKFGHVPYGGSAPAVNDLTAGHVDFMFVDLSAVLALSVGGKLNILATSTAKRVPSIARVPTLIETGIKDFAGNVWWGFASPPGTPLAIREKIAAEIKAIVHSPEVSKKLTDLAVIPLGSTPAEMSEQVRNDSKLWSNVIEIAKIRAE